MTPSRVLSMKRFQGMGLGLWCALSFRSSARLLTAMSNPLRSSSTASSFKKQLPDVFVASTHYKRALRDIKHIKPNLTIKNLRDRQRKLTSTTMDAIMKGLTVPITHILASYSALLRQLHPFDATVAELVIRARVKRGLPDLPDILLDLRALRDESSRIAKYYAFHGRRATSSVDAKRILDEGLAVLRSVYNCSDAEEKVFSDSAYCRSIDPNTTDPMVFSDNLGKFKALGNLLELQKELRRIPAVELDTLTVVLVGTPNVGKSSIVRAVSTGTPEVNDYPFTTRSVTVGHIVDASRDIRFQVMDTPGLLNRPVHLRNEMENLTFAAMAHLPTAVIYVLDPSGLSGEHHSSLDAQLAVREALRSRFPQRPWLDVVSKSDLEIHPDTLSRLPPGHLHVSVQSGANISELKARIEVLLLNEHPQWLALTHRDSTHFTSLK
jgi:nucleolar GTP-binding protein